MNWTLLHRIITAVLTLTGIFAGLVVVTQNTGLSQTALTWLGIWSAFCTAALAVLPSLFGVSGLAPKQETAVVREAQTEAVVEAIGRRNQRDQRDQTRSA